MSFQNFLLFNPERVLWIGLAFLGGTFLFGLPFLPIAWKRDPFPVDLKNGNMERKNQPLVFSLDLDPKMSPFPFPDIEGEMTFSFDPPRPDGVKHCPQLLVRLKKSAQSKRISLPSRLNLQYGGGEKLFFSESETPFWVELTSGLGGQIEGKIFVYSIPEGKIEAGQFTAIPQESPIQSPQEFPEGSPFRLLAESRWWGKDLFREKYGDGVLSERLEIGSSSHTDLLEICEREWLSWQEGRWQKCPCIIDGKIKPIARIQLIQGKSLYLEGWDNDRHIRLCLAPAVAPLFKIRGDELFSSIRVRSEKQISCMLEKQCLILKTGDWVLKNNGRWKVLRKKEERESYLNGSLIGELFVFDKIEMKQGQKYIQGQFFNLGRSQEVAIEMAAHTARKSAKDNLAQGEKGNRKGGVR